jgi:hypothetical protein
MLIPGNRRGSGILTINCGGGERLEVTETCTFASMPGAIERDEGETWIVNGAACVTETENVSECVMEPLVAVTLIVLFPVGVFKAADN